MEAKTYGGTDSVVEFSWRNALFEQAAISVLTQLGIQNPTRFKSKQRYSSTYQKMHIDYSYNNAKRMLGVDVEMRNRRILVSVSSSIYDNTYRELARFTCNHDNSFNIVNLVLGYEQENVAWNSFN